MELLSKITIAFDGGGIWMWAILIIQLFSVAIIIERAYSLYSIRKMNQSSAVAEFEEPIRRGDIDRVVQRAQELESMEPVAKAVLAGAKTAQTLGGKDEIQGKMDEVLMTENSKIQRRIGFLAMFGNVATLLGLLGTITGMIQSFAAVSVASPAEKAAALSVGISEAMNTTAYGLIVAIPALIAYAVLQNRANHLSEDLNNSALKAFNWLSYAYEPVGFRSLRQMGSERSKEINV